MRHWIQVLLLATAAVVCLGTSKRLIGKKLVSPHVQAAPGVTLIGEPKAALQENVNNQGCFAKQRIDFVLSVDIRNETNVALRIHTDGIKATVGFDKGQQAFGVDRARFLVGDGKHRKQQGDGTTLAPGTKGTLQLEADSILPKERLKEIRWVRLSADLQGARMVLEFRDIGKLKTETTR